MGRSKPVSFGRDRQLRSEFYYDGRNRRGRVVEIDNAVVQSNKRIVWSGVRIGEERQSNGTIIGTFFGLGEEAVQRSVSLQRII